MLCGNCGIALFGVGAFGYVAWQILVLVHSIGAIHGDGGANVCTDASFKWLWWICISSALFSLDLLIKVKGQGNKSSLSNVGEFVAYFAMLFILALGFGIGTQYQYLDGCVGKGHDAMVIYMWGNYAVASWIALFGTCFAADAYMEQKKSQQDDPCSQPPV